MSAMSERLSVRKVREILRLKFECKRSRAEIAAAACVGESTVSGYLARAEKAGLTWEVAREMTDAEIEARLFRDVGRNEPPARVPVDFSWVHRELSKPCVTLQTLWLEYREASAAQAPLRPYEYSRFCDLYAGWKKKLGVVMRQVHRAGEKVFIDYSGRKPHLVDRTTGEAIEVELFVAVLGASNYTYDGGPSRRVGWREFAKLKRPRLGPDWVDGFRTGAIGGLVRPKRRVKRRSATVRHRKFVPPRKDGWHPSPGGRGSKKRWVAPISAVERPPSGVAIPLVTYGAEPPLRSPSGGRRGARPAVARPRAPRWTGRRGGAGRAATGARGRRRSGGATLARW
ncbi:hypothetical protein WMF37_18625 [Sorangium sp. So ce291]|uniref:hypothetical protein n=1 Tax=Sorangium sp. So ce291 TaxID=3133294 RepID=UPI003F6432DC